MRFCIKRVSILLLISPLCNLAHRQCVSSPTESHSCCWSSPVCPCSQDVCPFINRASILFLIIPCAFLLIESVFLHQQSLIPVTDHPLCVLAHRWYVSVFHNLIPFTDHPVCSCLQEVCFCINRVSFLLLIIPCSLVLTESVSLYQQSLNPVANYPLCILAHSWCVSASKESHSCHWSSPVCSCS